MAKQSRERNMSMFCPKFVKFFVGPAKKTTSLYNMYKIFNNLITHEVTVESDLFLHTL